MKVSVIAAARVRPPSGGDTTEPDQVTGLTGYGLPAELLLRWNQVAAPDLARYLVQTRPLGLTEWVTVADLTVADLSNPASPQVVLGMREADAVGYRRAFLLEGVDYECRVVAVDGAGNQATPSATITAKVGWPSPYTLWMGTTCRAGRTAGVVYNEAAVDTTGAAAGKPVGQGLLVGTAQFGATGIVFDASSTSAYQADADALVPLGGTTYTIMLLMRLQTAAAPVSKRIVKFGGTSGTPQVRTNPTTANRLTMRANVGGTNFDVSPALVMASGEWYAVMIQRNGATLLGKVNDTESSIATLPAGTANAVNQQIALWDPTFAPGEIAAMVVYSNALSSGDEAAVRTLFRALAQRHNLTPFNG
jgi:hypothetical protein